jgi:hypothetical protein
MNNIKRFMDRVSAMDLKPTRDLVIPAAEARLLRDEIVKLLADRLEQHSSRSTDVIQVEVTGGNFKQ